MDGRDKLTEQIKNLAGQDGWAGVAIAPATPVAGLEGFEAWLAAGHNGEMAYLARNPAGRFDPVTLMDGAASVICLAMSYRPRDDAQAKPDRPFIARYARGRDYHKVLKKRCHRLMDRIRQIAPQFAGRAAVDSAPLAERSLAAASGLGWIGRNGCLIVPGAGSYVVLAEIICNLPLVPGSPIPAGCGDCRACLEACPTGACLGEATIDAPACLSYLSVEHRGPVPERLRTKWGNRLIGCDSCQEVCPHNRDVPAGDDDLTNPPTEAIGLASLPDILRWRQEDWDMATRGSAVRRASYEVLVRNAIIAAAWSGQNQAVEPLKGLREDGRFGELVDWALARMAKADRPD